MKKIFSLLLLGLLCSIGTTWAAVNTSLIEGITLPSTPSGTYTGGTVVVYNGTYNAVVVDANGNGVMQAVVPGYGTRVEENFTWTNACDPTDGNWSTTGTTWEAPNNSLFVGSSAYTTEGNAHYVNFARRGNLRNVRTFAYRFTNCGGVSALVKSQGTSDAAAAVLAVYKISGNDLIPAGSASSKAKAVDVITVEGLLSSETYVAFVYGMNGSNGELYEIAFLAPATDPAINAVSEASISATESGVEVTEDIAIAGQNLTGSTLTATLNPAVAGLSVTLASNTISAGSISTTATLHYTQTENASGSTTLILSDGTTSKNITVNYVSSVMSWTLQSVSEAKTWDFASLSGGVKCTGDSLTTEFVYANITEITCSAEFDGTALAFTGEYPLREGKAIAQNGTLHFHTTVPGTIVVRFSDTGTSPSTTAVKRYLIVNGETTTYWASRENTGDEPYAAQLNVTTDPIAVPAGDVTISGTSALVYSVVSFTPYHKLVAADTDFYGLYLTEEVEIPSGITAFTGNLNQEETSLVLTQVTGSVIPAQTPVIVKATAADTYFFAPSNTGADAILSSLKGVAVETPVAELNNANDGKIALTLGADSEGVVAFRQPAGTNLAANKVYILVNTLPTPAPVRIVFAEDNATNIENLDASEKAVKFIKNGQLFIQKDGVVYTATGAVVR